MQQAHTSSYTPNVREGNRVGVWVAALVVFVATAPAMAQVPDVLTVYDAIPHEDTVHLVDSNRRQFSVWVEGEGLQYRWTLDGIPIGDRHSLTLDPATLAIAGPHRLVVTVEGPAGRATRTWTVVIEGTALASTTTATVATTTLAPQATTTVVTTSTTTRRTTTLRATTTERPTTTTSTTETTTTRPPATTTTTTRPSNAVSEFDVRALLARYVTAWRAHDADALRAIGQVSTEGQMEALRQYFDTVRDLDVDVTVLEIRTVGDEARVRFIRRDHFKDPAGNPIVKESPPIEKRVIRTPGGLAFAPVQ
jgi:hypothetical protein